MKKFFSLLLSGTLVLTSLAIPASSLAGDGVSLNISSKNISHEVSNTLYGAFIEDISKACDGGLVSNLIYNNSFEYNDTNEENHSLNEAYWDFDSVEHSLSTKDSLNSKNPSYEVIKVNDYGSITNLGCVEDWKYKTWDQDKSAQSKADMGFQKDVKYDFSCYIKNIDFDGDIFVSLASSSNEQNRVQLNIEKCGKSWQKVTATLQSTATENGGLCIDFYGSGSIQFDFAELVPQNSYGYGTDEWKYTTLRPDLTEALKNLSPSFIRFPGGCFCEGDSLENLYDWKETIGPLEERAQTYNVWRNDDAGDYYINTNAMGYGEYFNLCADFGAEPLPCLNVGLTCQGRNEYDFYVDAYKKLSMSDEEWTKYLVEKRNYDEKDEKGIKERTEKVDGLNIKSEEDFNNYIKTIALEPGTAEWDNYVQDIFDLIEYANGSSTTTYWGAIRAANGHTEPYNLKYIELGNENWGDVYWRNFDALYKAVKEKYPDIQIVTTAGTWLSGDDFDTAWKNVAEKYSDCYVDEHYYTSGGYMYDINNRYDSYDRNSGKVFVGEYAATSDGVGTIQTKSNIWEAVEEGAYMTGFERNGDVVAMTAYAPTFAKVNSQNWAINEIWFDSQETVLTPTYYTQMLYSNNYGSKYIDASFSTDVDVSDLAQSVTIDEDNQVIYVKLVNSSGKKQNVSVNVDGFDNVNYVSNQYISENYKSACNEIGKNYVVPKDEEIKTKGGAINLECGKYSVNVLRIAYGDNDGSGLYQLPESKEVIGDYVPPAIKIAVPATVGGIIVLSAVIIILVKLIKKHKKNK